MPDTLLGLILCTFIMSKYVTYLANLLSLSERFSLMLVLPVLPGIIILFVSLVVVLPVLPGIIILFVSLVVVLPVLPGIIILFVSLVVALPVLPGIIIL